MDAKELRKQQEELLFPCVGHYYEEPLVVAEPRSSAPAAPSAREELERRLAEARARRRREANPSGEFEEPLA